MAGSAASVDAISKGTGAAAIGFGAAALAAPTVLASLYGMKDKSNDFRYLGRLWGSRMVALGGLTISARPGPQRRQIILASTAMEIIDVIVSAKAAPNTRTKVMVGATSGLFGLLGVYAAAMDKG